MSSPPTSRQALRAALLAGREQFMSGASGAEAAAALSAHLIAVLAELEPECLGLYWPHRSEFNASAAVLADSALARVPKCLPFARRAPPAMEFRAWDGTPPALRDDCGIPACDGAAVVPDVVLVPCVGFTAAGLRLGYGGGFFDRWLAQHPDATSIGVAWSGSELASDVLVAEPHDLPLTLIVTERGVVVQA